MCVVNHAFQIYSCAHYTTNLCLYKDFKRIFHYNDLFCVIFFGVAKAWFIYPVGYYFRYRGNQPGYYFVYIDNDLPYDSTSLKCTKNT